MRHLAAIAATAVVGVLVPASAQASPGLGTYTLKSVYSGKCVDVRGSSTADGAVIVQNGCDGRASQRFVLSTGDSSGKFKVKTAAGKCMSANTLNTGLIQQTCAVKIEQNFAWGSKHPWDGERLVLNVLVLDYSPLPGSPGFLILPLCPKVNGTADDSAVALAACQITGTGDRSDTFLFQAA